MNGRTGESGRNGQASSVDCRSVESSTAPQEQFLDHILALTQTNVELTDSDRASIQGLRQIASEIGDVPFSRDAVLLALVRSLLRPFRLLTPAQFELMTSSVANTIFDDPAARDRVARLWENLRRSVRHAE